MPGIYSPHFESAGSSGGSSLSGSIVTVEGNLVVSGSSTLSGSTTIYGSLTITGSNCAAAGQKIFAVRDNTYERENIQCNGTKVFCETNYGAYLKDTYFENIVSITGSTNNLFFSTNQVLSASLICGVGARVITTFQTSSGCWFAVGLSASVGGFSEYWGNYIGVTTGITNATGSLKNGWTYLSQDASICLSSSVLQSNAITTGSVRVVCFYRSMNPLLS